MDLSVKSLRILKRFGVPQAFERGETMVLVGRTYALRKAPDVRVRLVFLHDDQSRLCVGYARRDGPAWQPVEFEPFSARALGYYERRLKRLGDPIDRTEDLGAG